MKLFKAEEAPGREVVSVTLMAEASLPLMTVLLIRAAVKRELKFLSAIIFTGGEIFLR